MRGTTVSSVDFRIITIRPEHRLEVREVIAVANGYDPRDPDIHTVNIDELLAEFHLSHLANNMANTLSGGERRRLEIARSLTIDPSFILLDEPFTGVDPKSIREIQLLIADLKARRGLGVLLTDHSVRETLAIADRVYLMFDGKVQFSGSPADFSNDETVRKYYLGSEFQL